MVLLHGRGCGRSIVTRTNHGGSSRAKERNLGGDRCPESEAGRAVLVERGRPRVGYAKANAVTDMEVHDNEHVAVPEDRVSVPVS